MEKGHSRKRKDSPSGLGNVLGMVSVNHFFFFGGAMSCMLEMPGLLKTLSGSMTPVETDRPVSTVVYRDGRLDAVDRPTVTANAEAGGRPSREPRGGQRRAGIGASRGRGDAQNRCFPRLKAAWTRVNRECGSGRAATLSVLFLIRSAEDLPKLERLELRLGGNCRSSGAGPLHHELKNAARSPD